MAKAKRGLPDSFSLNVSKDEPVQWGDYVEEEMTPRRREVVTPATDSPKVLPMPTPAARAADPAPVIAPRVARETERQLPQDYPEDPLAESPRQRRREPVPQAVRQFPRPLRVQLNLSADTQRMLEALMDDVQTYSAEKKAGMADIYEALILAAYEAREENDFARVRPRGRWGTPTAAAFRVALKSAFQRGIAAHVQKEG